MNAQNDLFNTKQHGEFILMLNAECTTRNHESFQVSYFFFFLESIWMKQWHFWIVFVASSLHCFLLHTFQICNFVNVVMSFKTFLWVVCIEPMKLTCDPVVLLGFCSVMTEKRTPDTFTLPALCLLLKSRMIGCYNKTVFECCPDWLHDNMCDFRCNRAFALVDHVINFR